MEYLDILLSFCSDLFSDLEEIDYKPSPLTECGMTGYVRL